MAKYFRVSNLVISKLTVTLRKKTSTLSELIAMRNDKETERSRVKEKIKKMVEEDEVLDSVAMVTRRVNESMAQPSKPVVVHQVMREDLSLRWRKIRAVSLLENSVRNLVLR